MSDVLWFRAKIYWSNISAPSIFQGPTFLRFALGSGPATLGKSNKANRGMLEFATRGNCPRFIKLDGLPKSDRDFRQEGREGNQGPRADAN
tara:strand:- start:2704 stop:2976 length:273 start_codon:yes stop_codon:yes gene_type:complete